MDEYIALSKPKAITFEQSELINDYFNQYDIYQPFIQKVTEQDYMYWDRARSIAAQHGLEPVRSWNLAKLLRRLSVRPIVLKAQSGEPFNLYRLKKTDEWLHNIDMYLGGKLLDFQSSENDEQQNQFIARGILEESIASSQLEGASTSRKVAKQMIAEGRAPRDKSEQMILNNYQVMSALEDEYVPKRLSLEMLYDIHARLTTETVPADEQYRLRRLDDDIVVYYENKIAYVPPADAFLTAEMNRLIAYANDDTVEDFIHPVVKAIFLHFWVGYLHPFTDGNGRLARTLFYWYLLKKGYRLLMYLPVSSVIKRAPGKYTYAYIYSEQDDLDITYFFQFHTEKILEAIKSLDSYVAKVKRENTSIEDILYGEIGVMNERQKRLIHHLIANPDDGRLSIVTHTRLNRISRPTAYQDIRPLIIAELIYPEKRGRMVTYRPTSKLLDLTNRLYKG